MGKKDDFELIFRSYYAPLKRFIKNSMSINDADDLVENLFVTLWEKQIKFESLDHMRAFMYRSAGNAGKNYLQLHQNSKRESLEDPDILETESHLTEMLKTEVIAELMRAINGLPSQCGKVISMAYIEGLSNSEIAVQLGINEQSVKNTKHRGLKILKQNLSSESFMLLLLMNYLN